MDNLDRTNVAQAAIAKYVLTNQLHDLNRRERTGGRLRGAVSGVQRGSVYSAFTLPAR